jgi:ribosomal-protein-alanine N-acetyltransferase
MRSPDAEPAEPRVYLSTPRTVVRTADESDAAAVVDYYARNRERLEPFDPERSPIFYEERFWRMQLRQNLDDLASDRALRLFVFPSGDPGRVIGNVGFSNIVRGVGQYCNLGYSIDGECEGKGMMSEALRAAIGHAFSALHFHRIEANYLPHNRRSGELLRRLGFVVEGYSRDYLRINGVWQDHVRAALVNPNWADGG